MKKIFLLTLLSVFFLSAFSQSPIENVEILSKINITKHIDDNEIPDGMPWSWWKYNWISTDIGGNINCCGFGPFVCIPLFKKIFSAYNYRGLPPDLMINTGENIIKESEERLANGEYRGSSSSKIAFSDLQSESKLSYILFQMNWNHDPLKPYNGYAEIIVSKTDNLGIK